ncbi:ABC transporter permease subunit [Streptomyces sp. NPDC055243]|uniref:ABC transporter permease subunit n=1 Tax=Streptomyces sp. NPDC055243 TaxID=3365720 RepID=UPI0037D6C0AE
MASLSYDLTLAGLAVGSAAALTGIGLIVTYRATGVLNFAHGAIAMVCAYVLRQLTVEWHWPLPLATAVTLLLIAPAIGLLLEKAVFRPLAVLGSDPAQTLVASIGVFILLVGGAALIWGPGAKADAPALVSTDPWVPLAATVALATAVWATTRWTRFGGELRAVVDNRPLAVLSGIDADRVASVGWAFGAFTAGLTGALLAPFVRLDPYGMPLLVMEVVAVAVAARMRSLSIAVVVALGLGVAQSQLTRLHPSGWAEPLIQALGANLFVVALLVAALVLPGIGSRNTLPRAVTARVPTPPGAWIVAAVLFLIPLGFAGSDLTTSVQVPALAVILLSLVIVTGRGGQISLGQAAYAGLGALFTALLTAGRFPGLPELPHLPALAVAVLLVAPLGLLTGWPAISRRGLALALATFAVGVGVSRFVFAQPYATSGLTLDRPAGFDSDRAYYVLELLLLAAALLFASSMRRGRMGRALAAMRDHEAGAAAAGVPVRTLKLTAFVAGAALAALGGGMLGMGLRAFDPAAYDPVRGLLWFAAVVVLGADSLLGALLAAALLVGLDAGTRGGVAAALIGVLAVLLTRVPPPAGRPRRRSLTPLAHRTRTTLPPPLHTPHIHPYPAPLSHPATRSPRTPPTTNKPPHPPTRSPHNTRPDLARWHHSARARLARWRPWRAGPARPPRWWVGAPRTPRSEPTDPTQPRRWRLSPTQPPRSKRAGRTRSRRWWVGAPRSARSKPTPPARPRRWRLGPARPRRNEQTNSTPSRRWWQGPARPPRGEQRGSTRPPARDGQPDGESGGARARESSTGPQTPVRPEGTGRYVRPEHGSRRSGAEAATRPPDDSEDGHTDAAPPPDRPRRETPPRAQPDHETAPHPGRPSDKSLPPGHPHREAPHPPQPHHETAPHPSHPNDEALPPGHPHREAPHPPQPHHETAPHPSHPNDEALPPTPRHPHRKAPHPLTAHGITATYDGFTALDRVDLSVPPGHITAVVGPNGAGKSTLFHCLAGTLRPDSGRITFDGKDITGTPAHARTRLGLARTFQQLAVFPSLTIMENVQVGTEQGRLTHPQATAQALRLFSLHDDATRHHPAADLPTGTLRRVELARALAGQPHTLLLDEPAAGLDTAEVAALARVLRALAADGMALLVVEHDIDLVADLADTVHVMAAGRIVTSGPPTEVLHRTAP